MRLSRRAAPLLLLLTPALASVASVDRLDAGAKALSDPLRSRDVERSDLYAHDQVAAQAEPSASLRSRSGTKDAPVDGRDGKPHEGPFVDDTKTDTSLKSSKDALKSSKDATSKDSVAETVTDKIKNSALSDTGVTLDGDKNVMHDKDRVAPKEGTTGTEGGVSERTRLNDGAVGKQEKTPDSPKSKPPLPKEDEDDLFKKTSKDKSKDKSTDKSKDKSKDGSMAKDSITGEPVEKPKGAQGLEKPTDLPEKPHDIPHPAPNSPALPKDSKIDSSKDEDTTLTNPSSSKPDSTSYTKTKITTEEDSGVIQPFHSFVLSLTMILFSEVGDKTFLVAALMAMRHPRLVVFSAAFSALIAMTVLSAVLGHAVPTLIPEKYTHFAAAVLFLVFGFKLMREGYAMDKDEGVGEEMKEVEMELEEKEQEARKMNSRHNSTVSPYMLEAGRGRRSRSRTRIPAPRSPSSSTERSPARISSVKGISSGLTNLCSLLLSPAWVQTFIMTFLGEWGDRSQIATIAMAAGQDYWWVTGGAVAGHGVCTSVAVIGGRAIAGRVSMRVVTLGGAFAFLAFGLIYLVEAAYS